MKAKLFLLFTFLLSFLVHSQSTNFPFVGGDGSGFSEVGVSNNCFIIALNPFSGGDSDGFSNLSDGKPVCTLVALNPFSGGDSDGFSNLSDGKPVCTLVALNPFSGGYSDGFSNLSDGKPVCTLVALNPFSGGYSDGFSNLSDGKPTCTLVALNPFSGGFGSGFHSHFFSYCLNVGLPVDMEFVYVKKSHNTNLLHWITHSERNNQGFHVLKSFDLEDWEDLGFVNGAGNSTNELDYFFTDNFPKNGIQYYQLKQVDFDGVYSYSEIKSIEILVGSELIVFPNPTSNKINFLSSALSEEFESTIELRNSNGQVFFTDSVKDINEYQIDLSNYTDGVYFIEINKNGNFQVFKVVKVD